MPKVSVIIPIYNSEKYISECLESVVNQTLKDIEIILVDDESTDNTPKILQQFAEMDSRIRVIRQKNAGAGAARNHGMEFACGEYLSILDADDFFEPDMLEKAYYQAKENNLDVIVFACDLYDNETGNYRSAAYAIHTNLIPDHQPFSADEVKKDIFKVFVGWSWDKLFKTSYVKENNLKFQEQRTTNDMLFVFSAIVKAQRIMTLSKILAHHRKEVVSLSVTREKSWMCFYDALKALKQQLIDWDLYERFEQDYLNYCVHFSLWNINTLAEPTKTVLHNKLRDEWYDEMGVTAHPMEYYYNRHEYLEYRKIYEHGPGEELNKEEIKEVRKKEDTSIFYRGWLCFKENGLKYTVNNIAEKIKKKL